MEKVSKADFQEVLSDKNIRVFQMIYLSILMGATAFLGIIVYMYSTTIPASSVTEDSVGRLNTFSLIHGALFIAGIFISKMLYEKSFTSARIESIVNDRKFADLPDMAEKYLGVIRTAKILRIALLEGPAFFGLVTCFIGVTSGVLYYKAVYWTNLISYAMLVYVLLSDFPTREKLMDVFNSKMGSFVEL